MSVNDVEMSDVDLVGVVVLHFYCLHYIEQQINYHVSDFSLDHSYIKNIYFSVFVPDVVGMRDTGWTDMSTGRFDCADRSWPRLQCSAQGYLGFILQQPATRPRSTQVLCFWSRSRIHQMSPKGSQGLLRVVMQDFVWWLSHQIVICTLFVINSACDFNRFSLGSRDCIQSLACC